jgi:4-hydroxybenzoate polyprenyltransferase
MDGNLIGAESRNEISSSAGPFDLFKSLFVFLSDIKIAHSIFALPFAASAIFFVPAESLPGVTQILWLVWCMIMARSFAMGTNRLLDYKIDIQNPRTANRKIASGELKPPQAILWIAASAFLFVIGAFNLNFMAGICAIPVLVILAIYPMWKRWSWFTHLYLGVCLGLSPMAVTVALNSEIPAAAIMLAAAISFWTAGFDIIYAILDHSFDLENQVKSVPVKFGVRNSLLISRVCFAVSLTLLGAIGTTQNFGVVYYLGVSLVAALLIVEHLWVHDADTGKIPRRLDAAFFNVNAMVSVTYFVFLAADRIWFHV